MKINIEFSNDIMQTLYVNNSESSKFLFALKNSSILSTHQIYSKDKEQVNFFKNMGLNILFSEKTHKFCLYIQHFCIFDSLMLENLLYELENSSNIYCITPNIINHSILFNIKDKDLLEENILKEMPILFYNNTFIWTELKKISLANNLVCAILKIEHKITMEAEKDITSIVRFHNDGNINILKNALLSLIAQYNCIANILLALQDLSINKFQCLEKMLNTLPWGKFKTLEILKFTSSNKKDIRSKMFNESFKKAATKYVNFLDYDDILFNDAYNFLINRLKETKKNTTFGQVYASIYDEEEMSVTERIKKYERGFSYEEFLMFNLFPIHSIMFNKSLCSLKKIKYFDEMKYFEDYYFTLQILDKNKTDWESLKLKHYVGDYMHSSSNNTLSFISKEKKDKLKSDPMYLWCEKEIQYLKYKKLRKRNNDFLELVAINKLDIVFFGASEAFSEAVEYLRKINIHPLYVCDNDKLKHGKIINGYKIHSPSEILNSNNKYAVIVTSMFYTEISNQLNKYSSVMLIHSYFYLKSLKLILDNTELIE